MKFLVLIALFASEIPVRSSTVTAYCDIHWQDRYRSWNQCYENHMNTKGPTIMTASK